MQDNYDAFEINGHLNIRITDTLIRGSFSPNRNVMELCMYNAGITHNATTSDDIIWHVWWCKVKVKSKPKLKVKCPSLVP